MSVVVSHARSRRLYMALTYFFPLDFHTRLPEVGHNRRKSSSRESVSEIRSLPLAQRTKGRLQVQEQERSDSSVNLKSGWYTIAIAIRAR